MIKNSIVIITLVCALTILLSGCGSTSAAVASSSTTPAISPATPSSAPSVSAPTTASPSTTPSSVPPTQTSVSALKTEVYYFITNQRCVTCLCFESRIKFVIENYYKDAISSGTMTFQILNIQQSQNAAIAKKYKAVGSQLFVNTIVNGVDHIKDIQEIWNWNCNNDPNGFMKQVQDVLDRSLKGQF